MWPFVALSDLMYSYSHELPSSSPPIPRSYKLREDKPEDGEDGLIFGGRNSPGKKRSLSPGGMEHDQDEESPNSSGRRKRKCELDILMEDKKVRKFSSMLLNIVILLFILHFGELFFARHSTS